MRPLAIVLGACTLASVTSAWFVDFSRTPSSTLVPRRGAFAIWGPIYTLLGASAVVLGSTRADPDPLPHALVGVALAITCVWSATVTRRRRVARAALAASALAAWASLGLVREHLLYSAAYGLFAGWLSVATTISAETDDTRALVLASVVVGSGSVALATPWPCVSLLWGLATQRVLDPAVRVALVGAVAALVGSVLRRYA